MRFALRWCVVFLLATTLVAQTTAKKKAAVKPSAMPAASAEEVQALRDAVAAQGRQIQQLQQSLQQSMQSWQQAQQQLQQAQSAATEAQQKAAAAETAASGQQDTVAKLKSDVADVQTTLTNTALNTQDDQKKFAALEGTISRFRWTGDIRVRGEGFWQEAAGTAAALDRQRARLRVRFGFEGKLGEDFVGGLSIATGTLGDPTSTNTTMTNFFDKHTIGLDKAYVIYHPSYAKWVTITSGKFAYTWNRTNNTFDPDLNPEGFSARFAHDLSTPYIKQVSFTPFLLFYNESGGGTDSTAVGGQVSANLKAGIWTATPSFSLIKWNTPDSLFSNGNAFATQQGSEGPGCKNPGGTPGGNTNNCTFAPNNMTNATFLDATGHVHFYSQFLYADFILNNQFKTPWARLPLSLLFEYENNLSAQDHPLATSSGGFNNNLVVRTDLGKQSHLYLADVSLGQTKNRNDIQFGYAWWRQEQDSVISSFDESDQRAPTNVLQNKFYVNWKMRNNIVAGYTFWYGRTLNTSLRNAALGPGVTPGIQDNNLKRMQFDLIYNF